MLSAQGRSDQLCRGGSSVAKLSKRTGNLKKKDADVLSLICFLQPRNLTYNHTSISSLCSPDRHLERRYLFLLCPNFFSFSIDRVIYETWRLPGIPTRGDDQPPFLHFSTDLTSLRFDIPTFYQVGTSSPPPSRSVAQTIPSWRRCPSNSRSCCSSAVSA